MNEDRTVQIAVIVDGKVKPVDGQEVTLVGGDRSNPTRMKFAPKGDVLVSDIAFPVGDDFPVIVQYKSGPDAEIATEKFNVSF
ncbi:MAG: hypothetical protein AAGA96_14180 [Verrucomicrobiota bacterium]